MQEKLAALEPLRLDIADDSAKHAGHAGAKEGGHYRLAIVSARFAGCGILERHRLIYEALGPMMRREIHALSIKALAPEETD
ncbi:MAG: BolA family transcriptional regulator [Rhodocyclales bacterium]|nr:BolA family transcriptional regulator [Rhodocyclales bacterium]